MLLELLAAAILLAGDEPKKDSDFYSPTRKISRFEEADSFFDREGNEHIVDDDGYCEDCDDYHDS